ncbi:cellulose biosynthesis cyclic di-GMP-binding regulatory protein BcsB [Mycobacterium hodleri]|uniref:cellulose biosynthesis cyclic di-GMP-binding regulatory protein BcsB n=1 Tax=Mycolicibacterium hodleri TaxID=49897 RepID=UPI0021F2764D|nr:cellulose biosynthesis cyclic di-GMP-binding regulatory protein BcsB [Mycolicibacterium hodleri]MCV7136667.1 cellulose biosynthesis cyclic di-GMP-binding regulatory protein BcsB [Mycolicibacterium hodleri]
MRRNVGPALRLLLAVLLTGTLTSPLTASADPLNADPATADELTMPWDDLGLNPSMTLTGANNNQDFTIPLQPGMSVRRLRGLIHAPVDFGAGFVEIDDTTGRFLATVDLPAVSPAQAVVPFDVDVSAAQPGPAGIGLSFTVREAPLPQELRCGRAEQVQLSDLAAVFAGNEPAPNTLAEFFPPILQGLTIYAPVDADQSEQQAALTLASVVARTYAPQKTAITVVKQRRGATPPPAPEFTRAVVIEGGDAAIDVVNAGRADVYLKVTGRGDQLADQLSPVVNQLQSLLQVPTARVDEAGSRTESTSDELSFGQLNIAGESTVLRTSKLTVGVDRSALGQGRVDAVQVHLLANYTPVASLDSASLMVRANGHVVYTSPLNDSGHVDAVFDLPSDFLTQRINFEFDLTFSPRQLCSPTIAPLTFQLDPRSTLTMRRGGPALGGFSAVPSEFSPEFLVAFDGTNPGELDYAARTVADIARTSGTAMMPRVVDLESAADSTTGALILANAATIGKTSLQPPIGGESSSVRIDLSNQLRTDIEGGLGSIQAFADQPRNRTVILVTTSGPWSLVEPILDYVSRLPGGWSRLDGNVAAAGAAGVVDDLSIDPGVSASAAPQGGASWPTWLAIGVGCVALAAVVAGAVVWRSRRRRDATGT